MRMVSPHRSLLFAAVSGTVDADYQAAWLTDGRPGFPVRRTGDLSLTVTPAASKLVDVVAVCHHNIRQAASIALGGSLSSTIPTVAHPPDGIPHNWYRRLAEPVSVATLELDVTGNTDPIVIGELVAGLSWAPEAGIRSGRQVDGGEPFAWEGEFSVTPPYDPGVAAPRRLSGELALTGDEWSEFLAIHAAQRNGTRPVLLIPDDTVNDAWLAVFRFGDSLVGGTHFVTLEAVEIPRVRW